MNLPRHLAALVFVVSGLATPCYAFDFEDADSPEVEAQALQALKNWGGPLTILDSRPDEIRLDSAGLEAGTSILLMPTVAELGSAMEQLDAEVTSYGYKVKLLSDILFDFDREDLKPEAEATLAHLATIINGTKPRAVRILGFTDSKGSESYNHDLSERRAGSVKRWLADHGIGAALLSTVGKGESNPVAPNTLGSGEDNPEGRAKNRRVEIEIRRN
jgi:outer membrane protein OmpA-like peptidoglycan-associated protein